MEATSSVVLAMDAALTRFSFNLRFTDASSSATTIEELKFVWLNRGPNSIINRLQLYNQSSSLVEVNVQHFWKFVFKETRSWDSGAQPNASTQLQASSVTVVNIVTPLTPLPPQIQS